MTLLWISLAIFFTFIMFQSFYILVPLFKNEERRRSLVTKKHRFSVLVPAYNEEKVLYQCIVGFRQSNYQNAELLIINDGSTDGTMKYLEELLGLQECKRPKQQNLQHMMIRGMYHSSKYDDIFVIDKVNGGKADSLNAGINYSDGDIVITLDADSILDPQAIGEMNREFQPDEVAACGGNVLIAQAFQGDLRNMEPTFQVKPIVGYQLLQYLIDFYLYKRAQASLGTMTVISGAFGAFRRHVLGEIGGFRKTIGEDMDITLKLHLWLKEGGNKNRISFVPTAKCYTECPDTLNSMFKQRVRWQKAFIDCLFHYKKFYFHKFTKRFSFFFLCDQFLIGTLNAFPVLATPVLLLLNPGSLEVVLALGLSAVTLFLYQSVIMLYIAKEHGIAFYGWDLAKVVLFLFSGMLVYRMINQCFVIYGTVSFFHQKDAWNKFERRGEIALGRVES
ncbi:glycosyltransferase family 2 protein [Peribacillus sp. SCS-155]|uniref:glycosyltransferase family 2 protein n=1 Tax=Peribacillus sedimenti TaxID=3115297 RepID=UPI0039063107